MDPACQEIDLWICVRDHMTWDSVICDVEDWSVDLWSRQNLELEDWFVDCVQDHMRTHATEEEEKPYNCTQCGAK